jgi:hypothetical protein
LKLTQIANLFGEIIEKCPELDGMNFVGLKPDLPKPMSPEGYKIVIRTDNTNLAESTLNKLKEIVTRWKLEMEQKETSLVIYKTKS